MDKIKPILFNTEMVRAIRAGRKTVTRRPVKVRFRAGEAGYNIITQAHTGEFCYLEIYDEWETEVRRLGAPYRPGEILYVRETWQKVGGTVTPERYIYLADYTGIPIRWRPSIHMPKEAARIFLRVTDVRVERLQDSFSEPISPIFALQEEGMDIGDDCRECIGNYGRPCCVDVDDGEVDECGILDEVRGDFSGLWDSTIKPADRAVYGWAANPWVWVIEFEVDKAWNR